MSLTEPQKEQVSMCSQIKSDIMRKSGISFKSADDICYDIFNSPKVTRTDEWVDDCYELVVTCRGGNY